MFILYVTEPAPAMPGRTKTLAAAAVIAVVAAAATVAATVVVAAAEQHDCHDQNDDPPPVAAKGKDTAAAVVAGITRHKIDLLYINQRCRSFHVMHSLPIGADTIPNKFKTDIDSHNYFQYTIIIRKRTPDRL